MKRIFFILLLLLSFGVYAQQPGTLDTSFGDTGIVLDPLVKGYLNVIALQSDGRIIAGGGGGFNDVQPFLLARYNTDGSRDTTFGNGGFTGTNELLQVFGMAVQPDDAIIAFSYTASDVKLVKYKKDGGLDVSFGEGGFVITSAGNRDIPTAIALQPDGKIVVGGYIINAENQARQFFLLRYLPDGTLDDSFAGGGIKIVGTVNGVKGLATLNAIALQKDGKIVVTTNDERPYVYRYYPDGSTDVQFGTNGRAYFQNTVDRIVNFGANQIAIQADGKIVGGGTSGTFNMQKSYLAVARINADGSIDSSFGKSGLQYVTYGKEDAQGTGLLLPGDGKIIVSGNTYQSEILIARFDSDGLLDSAFGINGEVLTDAEGDAGTKSAVLQKDNKIVLGGNSFIGGPLNAVSYFLLARYNNDPSQRQRIITKIRRYLQHHGITWQTDNNVRYYTVQRSLDGGVTYQPLVKLYNNHQSVLTYEDASATSDNAVYRVAVVAKDGGRSFSNSVALTDAAGVRVFPNPVRSTLQVQGLPQNGSSLNITDFSGNVRTSVVASGGTASLNTSALKPGNYLLKVQSGNTVETRAFVKE